MFIIKNDVRQSRPQPLPHHFSDEGKELWESYQTTLQQNSCLPKAQWSSQSKTQSWEITKGLS